MAGKREGLIVAFAFFGLLLGSLLGQEQGVYRVSSEQVYFRAGPGTGHAVLGTLQKGDTVELLEKTGKWLKVRCLTGALPGKDGYLHQGFVEWLGPTRDRDQEIMKKEAPPPKKEAEPQAQTVAIDPSDQNLLKDIAVKMLTDSLVFLGLIKQMEPKLIEGKKEVNRVPKVKVIKGQCQVTDGFFEGSKVLHYPYINETFVVAEEGDDHYKFELPGNRSGWIEKSGVQFFQDTESKPVVTFSGVDKNEVARLLTQLSEIFNRIVASKNVADKIISTYNRDGVQAVVLSADYEKINKYYRLSSRFYEKFGINENLAFFGTKASFMNNLRLWGELLLGTEMTESRYAGQIEGEETGGGKYALVLGGSYRVNDDLDFSLDFGSQKEVMLEVFSHTNLGVPFTIRAWTICNWLSTSVLIPTAIQPVFSPISNSSIWEPI